MFFCKVLLTHYPVTGHFFYRKSGACFLNTHLKILPNGRHSGEMFVSIQKKITFQPLKVRCGATFAPTILNRAYAVFFQTIGRMPLAFFKTQILWAIIARCSPPLKNT